MCADTYFYRIEARSYSYVVDAEREEYGVTPPRLELDRFKVVKETPRGHWVRAYPFGPQTWVSKTATKRLCHPTLSEALEAYRQRKLAFLRHAQAKLRRAERELELLDGPQPAELEQRRVALEGTAQPARQ